MNIIDRLKSVFTPQANVDNDNNLFADQFGAKMVFRRKELPSPGAMNYAYETLALAPQSEISGAVAQRQQLSLFAAQVYKYQDIPLQGIGLVSGQVIGQPLFDPASGYTELPFNGAHGDLMANNIVADRAGPRGMNAPFLMNP